MTTRERFEKVRREQRNRFSLRTRLKLLVTAEILCCILMAYGLDLLLTKNYVYVCLNNRTTHNF